MGLTGSVCSDSEHRQAHLLELEATLSTKPPTGQASDAGGRHSPTNIDSQTQCSPSRISLNLQASNANWDRQVGLKRPTVTADARSSHGRAPTLQAAP
jgi:hypothetical protein